jgi:signal transduction histidine kinase
MPFAIQKEVSINLNTPESEVIFTDPEEMEIIMNNLVSNAIKYNKEHGRVDIDIEKNTDGIEIRVKDTGIGIKSSDQEELFKDFVRIKNPETRNITGSGLGLSIIKKIIDNNNWKITVESETNVGSTFIVKIPVLI